MNIGTARRYAKALFDLAQQDKQLAPIREQLEQIDQSIRAHAELRDLCQNPRYHQEEKKRILGSLADRIGSPPILKRFLELLVQKNRLPQLPEITKVFGILVDEAQGVEHVRVRAARPLSKDQQSQLKRQLETLTRRNVDLVVNEEPSLIGGMVVYAGTRVYDGSVKGQLQRLRRELVK
jgi:F-type H+-transporting ATPase subunit delta